jgi:hypothetical protein
MKFALTSSLREDFLIKLYFDTKEGFHIAGIKSAFLDFSRTLPVESENRATIKQNAINFIMQELQKITWKKFKTQNEFDDFHEKTCTGLKDKWEQLTFGQAQKWINMTLKYWLLFGEKRINGIEKNAKYFHIPIDRYVQKGMFKDKKPSPWSKINNYKDYFDYQKRHRQKNTGNYPIIDEFNFFNKYQL